MPVSPRPDRDRAIERLLRDAHEAPVRTALGSCVGPEELAAWVDGGLAAEATARVETHLASCGSCRALLAAFSRTERERPAAPSRGRLRLLLPIAAAAVLVIGVWLGGPRPGRPVPEAAVATLQERQLTGAAETAPAVAPPAPAPPSAAPATERRRDLAVPAGAPVAAPPSMAAPPSVAAEGPAAVAESQPPRPAAALDLDRRQADAAAPRAERFAANPQRAPAEAKAATSSTLAVTSPDGGSRWRSAGGSLEVSNDGGATWQATSGVGAAELAGVIAGASPVRNVSWLVGRDGLVLITGDGSRFTRASVPAPVPLTGVVAVDAATAEVRAADGRAWRTADTGRTWTRVP